MKAKINRIDFQKEFETKFGVLYSHKIQYDEDKVGFYSSKKKEQNYFKVDQEAEFTEEFKESRQGPYTVIKPIRQGNFSDFNKNLKKEQSRYAGFAVSYCKDLIIAEKLKLDQWEPASKKIFNFMVQLDKSTENGNS